MPQKTHSTIEPVATIDGSRLRKLAVVQFPLNRNTWSTDGTDLHLKVEVFAPGRCTMHQGAVHLRVTPFSEDTVIL